jgi:hypothetical protein
MNFVLTSLPKLQGQEIRTPILIQGENVLVYVWSETRSAFSYKSSVGLSPTTLPIRVISSPFLSSFEPRPFTIVVAIDSLPY